MTDEQRQRESESAPEGRVRPLHSVRFRFLAINLTVATALLLVVLGAYSLNEFRRIHEELTDKLDRIVVNYGILVAEPLMSRDAEQVSLILAASTDDPDLIGIAVRGTSGGTVAQIGQLSGGDRPELQRVKPLRMATAEGLVPIGELHVVLGDERLDETVDRLLRMAALLVLATLTAALIGSVVAHENAIGRPLRRLMDHIGQLAAGKRVAVATPERDDELGVLVRAFNRLQAMQDAQAEALKTHQAELEQRVRERTSELEEARDVAEAASRAKSQFLANLSHELRTPLNAITGFADLLKSEPHGPMGDRRYPEYAEDIASSASHLTTLINNLLDLSKADAGKLKANLRPADLDRLVDGPIRLMRVQASEAGLIISREVPENLPLVFCDPQMVNQILLNLLSNAVKFTPSGGKVTVSASVIAPDRVELAVADTGVGIPPDQIARVLEPFEQLDSSLQKSFAGTGLGLPLSSTLAELQGGQLTVESEGRGTTVRVSFVVDESSIRKRQA